MAIQTIEPLRKFSDSKYPQKNDFIMINAPNTSTKFSPITVNDVFNVQSSAAVDFVLIVDEFGQLKLSTAETSFSVDWMRAGKYTAHIQSKDGITELPFVKL